MVVPTFVQIDVRRVSFSSLIKIVWLWMAGCSLGWLFIVSWLRWDFADFLLWAGDCLFVIVRWVALFRVDSFCTLRQQPGDIHVLWWFPFRVGRSRSTWVPLVWGCLLLTGRWVSVWFPVPFRGTCRSCFSCLYTRSWGIGIWFSYRVVRFRVVGRGTCWRCFCLFRW